MVKGIRSSLSKILRQLGLKDEFELPKRYPNHRFGSGTYGNLIIRDFLGVDAVSVGSYTSIGPGVQIMLGADHRVDWVTTYPFNINWPEFSDIGGHPKSNGSVFIGSDVWIGLETVIMSGVTIGDGAVIGARSVVTKDIPPYAIAVGSPAKVIKYRFDPSIVERLEKIKWWTWSETTIRKAVPDLLSLKIEEFCDAAEAGRYE